MRFQTRCLKSSQRTLRPGSNRSALSRALHRCLLRPGQVQLTSLGRLRLCLLSCRFWGKASYGFSGDYLRDRLRSAKISQGKALVRFSRWRGADRIWIGESPRLLHNDATNSGHKRRNRRFRSFWIRGGPPVSDCDLSARAALETSAHRGTRRGRKNGGCQSIGIAIRDRANQATVLRRIGCQFGRIRMELSEATARHEDSGRERQNRRGEGEAHLRFEFPTEAPLAAIDLVRSIVTGLARG